MVSTYTDNIFCIFFMIIAKSGSEMSYERGCSTPPTNVYIHCVYTDPVGHHSNTERHSIENFRFTVIEKVRENNYFYRTARELFWMKKLKTTESPGINKKE